MEAAAQPLTAKGEATTTEPTRLEQAFARRVAESAATIPTATAEVAVPVPGGDARIAAASALARALAEHPRANGVWRDARFERYSRVNVAIALTTADGLVAPTLFDAATRPAAELEEELATLTAAAHEGRLTSPQMSGATTTLWLAPQVDRATAPVAPGQAVALAVAVRDDRATLTLSYDQRVLHVEPAAALLARIAELLGGGAAG